MHVLRSALVVATTFALVLAGPAPEVKAGGFLVPARGGTPVDEGWGVRDIKIRAQVRGSHAFVTVQQVIENLSPRTIEAEYVMPLPPGGVLGSPGLTLDGTSSKGELLTGAAAREASIQLLRRHRDARLTEHLGRDLYRLRKLELGSLARRTIVLTYEQEIEPVGGVADLVLGLRGAALAPLDDATYRIDVDIELRAGNDPRAGVDSRVGQGSRLEIGPVHSPTHDLDVRRDHARHAFVHASGALTSVEPDFRVFWTTTRSRIGATMLTYWPPEEERGYFLLVASPSRFEDARLLERPKDVTFVVDTSGSMEGDRLEDVREALLEILDDLDAEDRFNVVTFSDGVQALWPKTRPATPDNRGAAKAYLERMEAAGATDLDAALAQVLADAPTPGRSSVALLVTDGRPTRGETRADVLVDRIAGLPSERRPRLAVLGIGVDVDAALLDRLARASGGTATYARPFRSTIPDLRRLYERVRHPMLTDPELRIEGIDASDVLPERLPDLARGGTIVVTGRYGRDGRAEIELAEGRGDYTRRTYGTLLSVARRGDTSRGDFPARAWALKRIAIGLDRLRDGLGGAAREVEAAMVLSLSERYGILTEYTSFLADETTDHGAFSTNVRRSLQLLLDLGRETSGAMGFAQAANQAERHEALRAPLRQQRAWLPEETGRDVARAEWPGVQQAGERTFFWRRGLGWMDSRVEDLGEVEMEIGRWSESFFKLLEQTSDADNVRLAQRGSLVLELSVEGRRRVVRIVDDR
ncbi:MAG: VWA domain-containing protein [Planctomycetota bacterium]|nr:VWA domain-containing protein [Planctomycetota bacterium]